MDQQKLMWTTLIPVTTEPQGRGLADGGSVEARSEQFTRSTPDPHSAETDSRALDRVEREDRGGGVQQSSETVPERASGGGRDGVDVYGLVESGKPKGECSCSSYAAVVLTATSQRESLGRPGRWGFGRCG